MTHTPRRYQKHWGGWTLFIAFANTHKSAITVIDDVYNNLLLMQGGQITIDRFSVKEFVTM